MTLDVIMPIYNALPLAMQAIVHLIAFTPAPLRFILIDNASDEPADRLRSWLGEPHVIIRNETNRGVYPALNQGLALAETDLVIVCCTDHLVLPGWASPCIGALQQFPHIGWASPEWKEGPWHIREMWNALAPQQHFGLRPELGSSCGILNWALLKERVGFFDEQFFFVYGDSDMVERMNDAGLRCAVIDGALSHHFGNQSRRGMGLDQDLALEREDAARFVAKWQDRPDVLARHQGVMAYADPAAQERIRAHREQLWKTQDPGVL